MLIFIPYTKLNKLHHIAIICSNYDISKNFYVNILGLNIINKTYRKEKNLMN
ncbi:VOC family protein [Romboutsia faecis]|uniref:VOC family protein n=1 Tax=Romboutsia faecis TaxID=2764597 RepID=UPI00295E63F3|nr:VOC family protein [Romboutsia faecis]